jgi:hypothetical protein
MITITMIIAIGRIPLAGLAAGTLVVLTACGIVVATVTFGLVLIFENTKTHITGFTNCLFTNVELVALYDQVFFNAYFPPTYVVPLRAPPRKAHDVHVEGYFAMVVRGIGEPVEFTNSIAGLIFPLTRYANPKAGM